MTRWTTLQRFGFVALLAALWALALAARRPC
jgi:hypothetical protein